MPVQLMLCSCTHISSERPTILIITVYRGLALWLPYTCQCFTSYTTAESGFNQLEWWAFKKA